MTSQIAIVYRFWRWKSLRLFLKAGERVFYEETRNLCRTKREVTIELFVSLLSRLMALSPPENY